jgi:hypothetical protein
MILLRACFVLFLLWWAQPSLPWVLLVIYLAFQQEMLARRARLADARLDAMKPQPPTTEPAQPNDQQPPTEALTQQLLLRAQHRIGPEPRH